MNTTIRRSALMMGVLMLALIINANVLAVIQDDELRARDGNRRQLIDEYDHQRGSILVGRRAIAKSVPTEDRLKYLRTYSDGPLYAPVTGYYSLYGATGIEKAENDLLAGTDDRLFVDRLTNLFTGQQPKGGNVLLTLDPGCPAGGVRWAGRASRVRSSRSTRAPAQSWRWRRRPRLTPTCSLHPTPPIVTENYDRTSQGARKSLLNRATQQVVSPGSLFKVVVAAAALESGEYEPDTVHSGSGISRPSRHQLEHQQLRQAPCLGGRVTLAQALALSCNTAFARIGMDLGDDALREQARAFGFNERLRFRCPWCRASTRTTSTFHRQP